MILFNRHLKTFHMYNFRAYAPWPCISCVDVACSYRYDSNATHVYGVLNQLQNVHAIY